MKTIRSCFVVAAVVMLLILTGCLEIVGQRITLHHDTEKDEVHLLIQYDGIFDSGKDEFGNGAAQVAHAIKDGQCLFFDWPFHIKPRELKANADDDTSMPPGVRSFMKTIGDSVTIETLGYHRDPQGQIGGSQLVTIKHAKAFFASANGAISSMLLTNASTPPVELTRSWGLLIEAAKKDHQWLSMDGHALRFVMPIHTREWNTLKAKGLIDIIKGIERVALSSPEDRHRNQGELMRFMQFLTASPITYSDADGFLNVRLGDTKTPSTLRYNTGKTYKGNLADAVTQNAPRDLDESMRKVMTGEKLDKDAAGVNAVAQWGPPEEKVRGLMRSATANDANLAAKSIKTLDDFSKQWNAAQGHPMAPRTMADTEKYLEAWARWYKEMLAYPLPARTDDSEPLPPEDADVKDQ